MSKPLCIYHSSDLDGKCAAAIVFHHYKGEVELHGMDYGDPIPWDRLEGREVIMVDFSFQPFDEMRKLKNITTKLTWLDHHKSAMSDAVSFHFECHGYKPENLEFAGCELAWKHFHNTDKIPVGVWWLGRYDIWKHEDREDILSFQSGMKSYETGPIADVWPMVFQSEPEFLNDTCHRGKIIQASMNNSNADLAQKLCFPTTMDGLRLIAVNRGPTGSPFFKTVWDRDKYDAMCAFHLRPDGQWSISLYSDKEEVDCSVVCKARGGGGHKGAAGFQTRELPFKVG